MIIVLARDIPPGLTAKECAGLVFGADRASRDLIVTVETVDRLDDDPEVSQQPAAPLLAPADSHSVAPSIVDSRGINFVTLQRQAEERGLRLDMLPDGGYRITSDEYGSAVTQHLADVIALIKHPRSILFT